MKIDDFVNSYKTLSQSSVFSASLIGAKSILIKSLDVCWRDDESLGGALGTDNKFTEQIHMFFAQKVSTMAR